MTENSITNDPLVLASDKIKRLFGVSSTLEFLEASDAELMKMFASTNQMESRQDSQEDAPTHKNISNANDLIYDDSNIDYKKLDRKLLESRTISDKADSLIGPSIILVQQNKASVCSVATGAKKEVLCESFYPIREPIHDFFRSFTKEVCPPENIGSNNEINPLLKLFLKGQKGPLYFNIQDDQADDGLILGYEKTRITGSEIKQRSIRFWLKMKCLHDIWTKRAKTSEQDKDSGGTREFNRTIFESDYAKTVNIMVSFLPKSLPNGERKELKQYRTEIQFIICCFDAYKERVHLKLLPYQLDPEASIKFSREMTNRFERLKDFQGADEALRNRIYCWTAGYQQTLFDIEDIFESQLAEEIKKLKEAAAKEIRQREHRKPSHEKVESAAYKKLTMQLYLNLLDKSEEICTAPVQRKKGSISNF